jgi:hypothetical protein
MIFSVKCVKNDGAVRRSEIIAHDVDTAYELTQYELEPDEVIMSVTAAEPTNSNKKRRILLNRLKKEGNKYEAEYSRSTRK